jgi:hypothetical protein
MRQGFAISLARGLGFPALPLAGPRRVGPDWTQSSKIGLVRGRSRTDSRQLLVGLAWGPILAILLWVLIGFGMRTPLSKTALPKASGSDLMHRGTVGSRRSKQRRAGFCGDLVVW